MNKYIKFGSCLIFGILSLFLPVLKFRQCLQKSHSYRYYKNYNHELLYKSSFSKKHLFKTSCLFTHNKPLIPVTLTKNQMLLGKGKFEGEYWHDYSEPTFGTYFFFVVVLLQITCNYYSIVAGATTLGITTLSTTITNRDTQHNDTQYCYSEGLC